MSKLKDVKNIAIKSIKHNIKSAANYSKYVAIGAGFVGVYFLKERVKGEMQDAGTYDKYKHIADTINKVAGRVSDNIQGVRFEEGQNYTGESIYELGAKSLLMYNDLR